MAEAKYWELENPEVKILGRNEVRFFKKAGKVQVFRRKEGLKHGVTKGATLELDSMSDNELRILLEVLMVAVDAELSKREENEEPKKAKKKTKSRRSRVS